MSKTASTNSLRTAGPITKLMALVANLGGVVVFCPHYFSWAGALFFGLLTFGTINLFFPVAGKRRLRSEAAVAVRHGR